MGQVEPAALPTLIWLQDESPRILAFALLNKPKVQGERSQLASL